MPDSEGHQHIGMTNVIRTSGQHLRGNFGMIARPGRRVCPTIAKHLASYLRLHVVQVGVDAVCGDQFRMRALLSDPGASQNDDSLGIADG